VTGDWWKRAQEDEHRTGRTTALVRPAAVLRVHLSSLDLVIFRDLWSVLHSANAGRAITGDGISVVLLTVPVLGDRPEALRLMQKQEEEKRVPGPLVGLR